MRTLFAAATLAATTAWAAPAWAYRLTVVAASELRLDPAVPPNSDALTVRVHLRDDRGAPLAGRGVSLTVQPERGEARELSVRTDENGDARVQTRVGTARRVLVLGDYAGDSTSASAQARIDVDFDAPFVTPELMVPGEGVTLGDGALEAVITVRVGEVQTLSPARLAVELSQTLDAAGRRRSLAAGETDGAGRAALRVPVSRFEAPGAVRLVPRVDLGNGRVVEGVGRELLVRGRTAVSLLRDEVADEGDGVDLHGAVVLSTGAPVPNAAVRLLRGDRTLVAARADGGGLFRARVGAEALGDPGVRVRAVFEPTEPWFIGAESPEVELTPPRPAAIPWSWGAAPLGVALLAVAAALLRRRTEPEVPTPEPPRAVDHVVRVADLDARGITLRVVVRDRSTGREVSGCRVRVDDGPWREVTAAPMGVEGEPGPRQISVEAEGYAPRSLRVELPKGGEYRVQLALRTWREELFGRLRPWLERARRAEALPTPRELARVGAPEELAALVQHVERGCYDRAPPGPADVRTADDLAGAAGRRDPAPRLDRR